MAYLWHKTFTTLRPLAGMPRLECVASESRDNAAYMNQGRFRQAETHCLFEYTLSGEGVFKNAAGAKRVPPGFGFLCKINDPSIEYYYPADAKEPWVFVFICFSGAVADALTAELTARHGALYEVDIESRAIRTLLEMKGGDKEHLEICAGEGAAPVWTLLAELEASANRLSGADDAAALLARKARAIIEESLPEGISAGELAATLEVSREHLSRVFVRQTGIHLRDYLARRRMLCACDLLKKDPAPLREIGEKIGIRLPQHFTRLFKRTFKMTPSQFRRHGRMPDF